MIRRTVGLAALTLAASLAVAQTESIPPLIQSAAQQEAGGAAIEAITTVSDGQGGQVYETRITTALGPAIAVFDAQGQVVHRETPLDPSQLPPAVSDQAQGLSEIATRCVQAQGMTTYWISGRDASGRGVTIGLSSDGDLLTRRDEVDASELPAAAQADVTAGSRVFRVTNFEYHIVSDDGQTPPEVFDGAGNRMN